MGLNFPGEILQLPGLLLLSLLHVEDTNRKFSILKPCSFARSALDELKMISSLQWQIGFHFHIKLILVQLQFSNLHKQKLSFEISVMLSQILFISSTEVSKEWWLGVVKYTEF